MQRQVSSGVTVRHRVAWLVTLSLLVPVAIALSAGWWYWRQRALETHRFAPVLTQAALREHPTFDRRCHNQKDCEPSLGCAWKTRAHGPRCLASECESDIQCEPGFVCRAVPTEGPVVRVCSLIGTQPELGKCEDVPDDKEWGCGPGLLCNGFECGRPCRLGDPSSCPDEAVCSDGVNGPSCVRSCARTGCPSGQECIQLTEGGRSGCGVLISENCFLRQCPTNQRCAAAVGTSGRVLLRCDTLCDRDRPCRDGMFCMDGVCRLPCERSKPFESCPPQQVCVYYPGDGISACDVALDF